jgi:hypothetical protein
MEENNFRMAVGDFLDPVDELLIGRSVEKFGQGAPSDFPDGLQNHNAHHRHAEMIPEGSVAKNRGHHQTQEHRQGGKGVRTVMPGVGDQGWAAEALAGKVSVPEQAFLDHDVGRHNGNGQPHRDAAVHLGGLHMRPDHARHR